MTHEEFQEIVDNNYDFFQFLSLKHADQYVGLDDEMPDDFSSWIENMEIDDAEKYTSEYKNSVVQSNKRILKCNIEKQEYTHRDVIVAIDQPDEVI